jgi:hypothetical protein
MVARVILLSGGAAPKRHFLRGLDSFRSREESSGRYTRGDGVIAGERRQAAGIAHVFSRASLCFLPVAAAVAPPSGQAAPPADISPTCLSIRHVDQSRAVHSAVPVGASVAAPAVVGEGAGAGLGAGAGSGATVAIVAGVGAGAGCGAGAAFGATLRAGGRFFGFAVFVAARLGARLATTFLFALVARFNDFSTRFFVFALLFDLALLLGLADFVFAFLAMRVAPCCVGPTAPTVAGMPQTCETH